MKRLFIAEKPELARAIVEGLGGGIRKNGFYECGNDLVTWCIGHMLELFEPEDYDHKYKRWSLEDLPIYHNDIRYKVKQNTESQFDIIIKLIDNAETIVHAGDPDAEGQLIVDEILDYCDNKKPVYRFTTNDNNKAIVEKALANLKNNSNYYSLYQSALARNIGDQLYGFNMTRAYTVAAQKAGYDGVLSVGRVQTPILGLVVNRDRANSNHEKQYYYDVIGDFDFLSHSFPAKYIPSEGAPVDDKKRITDKDFAKYIVKQCEGNSASVIDFNTEIKYASPPLPYNMLKLQVAAAKQYNYKPDQVMKITQELREKYKLITYNGSDCQYLNEEQHADAKNVLNAISQTAIEYKGLVSKADHEIKSRAFNNKNVSAHHAIIPTEATVDLSSLNEPLRNIYLLISQAYIAQFYPKMKYQDTEISLDCEGHEFSVRSKKTIDSGWKVLYKNTDEDEKNDAISVDLSELDKSKIGKCVSVSVKNKETKPLPLYTMATLLTDLTRVAKYIKDPEIKKLLVEKDKDTKGEHGGIGTSRTRDLIIKKLFDLEFLSEKGKKIISTKMGKQFFDALPEVATSPDMTALWHEQQTMIGNNKKTTEEFVNELVEFITKQVNDVKTRGLNIKIEGHKCHQCEEGKLRKRKGKNGDFWGCSNYPECKATLPSKGGKPDYKSLENPPCPNCKKEMKRRKSANGFFWGCTGYPECKTTLQDNRGKPQVKPKKSTDKTEFKCDQCQKTLVRRIKNQGQGKDKREIPWYGCSGFPACKQTYFDLNGQPKY